MADDIDKLSGKSRQLANLTGGSRKGIPNKATKALKDMILEALEGAGGVDYLILQAQENPGPFMSLVGKLVPADINLQGKIEQTITTISDQPLTPDEWAKEHAPQPTVQ